MSINNLAGPFEDFTFNSLPEGWCWAKLNEIVKNPRSDIVDGPFGSDLKASEYLDKGVPIIRLQNIERNNFITKNIRFIRTSKAQELKRHNFHSGDIVITKLGDPLGKACIVPESFGPGIVVADIVRLRLSHNLCSLPYLVYALNSSVASEQLLQRTKGTTRPRVNLGNIRSLKIPLAPLAEQKRIAAKVEELFARVNAAKERLARVALILKRFRQSVVAAACSGQLTAEWADNQERLTPAEQSIRDILKVRQNFSRKEGDFIKNYAPPKDNDFPPPPKGWTVVSSDVLFSFVTSGSRGWAKYYAGSGPIFIRIGNLDHNSIYLNLSDIQHVNPPSGAEQNRTRVQPGDILISITADVGMTALVPDKIGETYVN